MRNPRCWFALAVAVLVVAAAGCGGGSTTSAPNLGSNGTLIVYASDGPNDVSAAEAVFTKLRVYNMTTGQWVDLLTAPSQTIDLVKAHTDLSQGLLGAFIVPAGDYSGIDVALDPIRFTMTDSGNTCVATAPPMPNMPMRTSVPVLTVTENGTVKLHFEMPNLTGYCPSNMAPDAWINCLAPTMQMVH